MRINITQQELTLLISLEDRLVNNYNHDEKFYQHEEDRLVLGHIIDKAIDQIRKGKKYGRNI